MWVPLGVGGVAARHLTPWASYAAAPVVGLATAVLADAADGGYVWGYLGWFALVYLAGVALSGPAVPTPSRTTWPVRDVWARVRRRLLSAVVGGLAAAMFLTVAHLHHVLPARTWGILVVVGLVSGFAVTLTVAACAVVAAVATAVVFVTARLTDMDELAEVVARWPLVVLAVGAVVVVLSSAIRRGPWFRPGRRHHGCGRRPVDQEVCLDVREAVARRQRDPEAGRGRHPVGSCYRWLGKRIAGQGDSLVRHRRRGSGGVVELP
jgi:hypothetical protein